MLQVRALTKTFRGLVAVSDVSFDVADNELRHPLLLDLEIS